MDAVLPLKSDAELKPKKPFRRPKDPNAWCKKRLPKNTPANFSFLDGLLWKESAEPWSWNMHIDRTQETIVFSRLGNSSNGMARVFECVRIQNAPGNVSEGGPPVESGVSQAIACKPEENGENLLENGGSPSVTKGIEKMQVETERSDDDAAKPVVDQGGPPVIVEAEYDLREPVLIGQHYSLSEMAAPQMPSTSDDLVDEISMALVREAPIGSMEDFVSFIREIGVLEDEVMDLTVKKAMRKKRPRKQPAQDQADVEKPARPKRNLSVTSLSDPSSSPRRRGRPRKDETFPTRQQIPRLSSPDAVAPSSPEKKPRKNAIQYYEVERVIGAALTLGKETYLIKWVGFPFEECSWEALDSVEAAVDARTEFYAAFGRPSFMKTIILSPEGEKFEKWKRECVMGRNARF